MGGCVVEIIWRRVKKCWLILYTPDYAGTPSAPLYLFAWQACSKHFSGSQCWGGGFRKHVGRGVITQTRGGTREERG